MGPFGIATILASMVFVAAGIVAPQAAEALLRLLLATLAVGFVAARAYGARLPERMTQHVYSPFDDHATGPDGADAPLAIRELATLLRDADDARRARRTPIPRKVRWGLIDEAKRRLAQHQGLSLEDPADQRAIRSLLSESTWSLLASESGPPAESRAEPARRGFIPLSQLHLIIDDLERL